MIKIFYADKSAYETDAALKYILSNHYGIKNAVILRGPNGKPFVENAPHFSVTHTKEKLFIAFSDNPIGLDAELLSREIDYLPILKKFPKRERTEIKNQKDFLTHWVIKESAIKYWGTTLAQSLQKLAFINNHLYYEEKELPLTPQIVEFENHLMCICAEEILENSAFIQIP